MGLQKLERELQLRLAMGAALQASKGYGATEVQQAYERAGELCQRLGETPQLFPALMGLWSFAVGRGDWKRSHQLAERNLHLAESVQDPAQLARSWRATRSRQIFPRRARRGARQSRESDRAMRTASAATRSVHLHLERRGRCAQRARMDARADGAFRAGSHDEPARAREPPNNSRPRTTSFMRPTSPRCYTASVRSGTLTADWSKRTIELATEHGLPYYQLMGSHMLGAAMAQQGQTESGLPMMNQAIQTSLAIGVEAGLTGMYLMIAEACRIAGEFRAGHDAINDAFRFVKLKDEHAWEPELLRAKGELLLEQHRNGRGAKGAKTSEKDAEENLLKSIELAHSQGAKKWELRAAVSLARVVPASEEKEGSASTRVECVRAIQGRLRDAGPARCERACSTSCLKPRTTTSAIWMTTA